MIQVIERVSIILELLADGEATLASLASKMGLQKSTLCNILRTLQDVGYVGRTPLGGYCVGQGLLDLTADVRREDPVEFHGRPVAERLADRLGETAVVSVLRGGRRWNVIRASSGADVIVSAKADDRGSVFNTATGRLLLSHADRAEVNRVVAMHGLPGLHWNAIKTLASLEKALAVVRQQAVVTRISTNGDVRQIACPVYVSGRVVASLGVAAVASRCTAAHVKQIETGLQAASRRLGRSIESGKNREAT